MHDGQRLQIALDRFNAIHALDPQTEPAGGATQPRELLYARRMLEWLRRLAPDAPEPLQLAACAQHLRRWEIPRSTYPMDRAGYHRWRTDLARFQAHAAGQVLLEMGYDPRTIERVQSLIRKEQLRTDAEAQLLEDVICLVFLENYFSPFAKQHDEEKLIGIIRRTWKKMSPRGREAALQLSLPEAARSLIEKALG